MALVDTNVLVYAHDRDAGDKHLRAVELVTRLSQTGEFAVSAQILNELSSVLHTKRKLDRAVVGTIVKQVIARATVLPLTGDITMLALGSGMNAGLAFWDALVWATAHANAISVIYTEDFQHDRVVEGVRFVDPFRAE